MVWRSDSLRGSLLFVLPILFTNFPGATNAQILLNKTIPDPNLGFGADYLRRGSGYGSAAEDRNAQETLPGTTVQTRAHPEYDAQGAQINTFRVDASGGVSFGYDSNPLGLAASTGSAFTETLAAVSAATKHPSWGVNTRISINDFRYVSLSQLDHTDYAAYLGTNIDVGRGNFQSSFTHLNLHLMPTGVDNLLGAQIIPFTDDEFRLSYSSQFGRLTVIPDASYAMFKFQQSVGSSSVVEADTPLNDNSNDRDVGQIGTTFKYELSPGRDLVTVFRWTQAGFPNLGRGVLNHTYNDVQVLGGLDVQTLGSFRYRGLIGYETRQFQSSSISSQSSPILEGQLIWTATNLTTATATAGRQIADAVSGGTNSFDYTMARLQLDHEVRRNVIFAGFAQIQLAHYEGGGSSTLYDAGANLIYRFNRHLSVVASYELMDRTSTKFINQAASASFIDQIALLSLRISL